MRIGLRAAMLYSSPMAKPAYKSSVRKKPQRRSGAPARGRGDRPPREPATQAPLPERLTWTGDRLEERTGMVLLQEASDHYALIDSGNGRKLERLGGLVVDRPEAQALWLPKGDKARWAKADAFFTGDTDEEGTGRWQFADKGQEATWAVSLDGLTYNGRFTSFRHLGVFPEQARHWRDLESAIYSARRPVRMLNLFGYTGLASLVAARAGAEVTHVDASKKAIGWARENQELAGLLEKPIRWICEDAMKFCAREVRRANSYDIILLDPPAFGRGPKGEVWQLFEALPAMLDAVRQLQSKDPLMTVLTAYAIRASSFALHEIMQEVFAGTEGRIESGELVLVHEDGKRHLPTSMFSRYLGPEVVL